MAAIPGAPNEDGKIEHGTENIHPLDAQFAEEMAEHADLIKSEEVSPEAPGQRSLETGGEPKLETPPAEPPALETEPTETKPAEQPPAAAETPPETPPVETKPPEPEPKVETPPEKPKAPPGFWARVRAAQKATKEAQQRLDEEKQKREALEAQLQQKPTDIPPEGDDLDDPLTKIQKTQDQLQKDFEHQKFLNEQERQRLELHQKEIQTRETVMAQEREFSTQAPDYVKALNFLVDSRREELDSMGVLDRAAEMWLIQKPEVAREFAVKMNKNPDDDGELYDSAKDLAFRVILDQERRTIIDSNLERGVSIPSVMYALAKKRGYQGTPSEPVASRASEAEKAQQRVQAAMRQPAVSQSLSAVQASPRPPAHRQIRTREDVEALTEAEILELDRTQPGWDRAIPGWE